jgi:hypothetical protein
VVTTSRNLLSEDTNGIHGDIPIDQMDAWTDDLEPVKRYSPMVNVETQNAVGDACLGILFAKLYI